MKTSKARQKRGLILQAAAKILSEKGYANCTLAEIGEEAGTFAGSLYYYFPSKEDLVEEVLNIGTTSISSHVMAKVAALPPSVGGYEKIKIALDEHVAQMLHQNDFVIAYWKIIDQVPSEVRERHQVHPRAYGKFWRDLLKDGQRSGEVRNDLDPGLIQLFLMGSTIYALDWYHSDGPLSPQEISDNLAEIYFKGISPRGEAAAAKSARLRVIAGEAKTGQRSS